MIDARPTCAEFDYGQYEPELADELHQAAERIRSRGQEQISAIIDIGKELNDVKRKVGHGNWGAWLNTEFAMSVATADRYMRGADFISHKGAQGKFVTVTNLTPGLLYKLSAKSAPPLLVQEAIERVETGAPMSEKEFRFRAAVLKRANRTATIDTAAEAAEDQRCAQSRPNGQQEAANAAVLMLRESLGDQFLAFVALFEKAGMAFSSTLRRSVMLGSIKPAAEANFQRAAAAAEPSRPEPAEPRCSDLLGQVAPTVPSVSEEGWAAQDDDRMARPNIRSVDELARPSAEIATGERKNPHQHSEVKEHGRAVRPTQGGATLTPPGVICSHKHSICGYTGCLSQGRCLAVPGSQATVPLRHAGPSDASQLPRELNARRKPPASLPNNPVCGPGVALQVNAVSLGK